jgi:hypothetical protein
MVSRHWEDIASRAVRRVRRDTPSLGLGHYPEADMRARARAILENLGTWLVTDEKDIALRYERLGRARFEEGVPLHELIYAWQVIKSVMMQFVREREHTGSPLEIYADRELQRGTDRIFNLMTYSVVRGYEQAMRDEPEKFGSACKPANEHEFFGPTPF